MNILFIGANPKLSGGVETFGRVLKKFYCDMRFISYYKVHDGLYSVDDVSETVNKNLITKGLNFISNRYFQFISIGYYIKRNYKKELTVAIINTPKAVLFTPAKIKILVQHTSIERMLDHYEFFSNNKHLIKYCKDNCIFVALSPQDKIKMNDILGVNLDNIHVIRHSCNHSLFIGNRAKTKSLVMLSRLDNDIKRIDLAINAMDKLSEFELHIYGDGKDKSKLLNLARDKTNVFFHGNTTDVSNSLNQHSIFISCSDVEGYPMNCVEAMFQGLPLIIRNTYGSAEDLIDNNGILLNAIWNEDAFISAVHQVYDNYDILSENSLRNTIKYNPKEIKKQWDKLLNLQH